MFLFFTDKLKMMKFKVFAEHDIKNMSSFVNIMYEYLYLLSEDENKNFNNNGLSFYLQSIVAGQRDKLVGGTKAGSWCLAPDDLMDSDARVDFIFNPTYLAVATLSIAKLNHPSITSEIDNYDDCLRKGLKFCTYRKLKGHGYDSIIGMLDAFKVLSLGKVPTLLHKNPELCIELKNILDDVANAIALELEKTDAHGLWGEDYSEGFSSALETMYLLNDEYFQSVFKSSATDAYTIKKDQLKW
jgi:hypothetical protein